MYRGFLEREPVRFLSRFEKKGVGYGCLVSRVYVFFKGGCRLIQREQ